MAVDVPSTSECLQAALAVQQYALGGTVSVDQVAPFPTDGSGTGAACMGTITGHVATVVAADGDPSDDGGMCSALGFSAVPGSGGN